MSDYQSNNFSDKFHFFVIVFSSSTQNIDIFYFFYGTLYKIAKHTYTLDAKKVKK